MSGYAIAMIGLAVPVFCAGVGVGALVAKWAIIRNPGQVGLHRGRLGKDVA